MHVAIQPCADPDAQSHYTDTVKTPVLSEQIVPHLNEEQRIAYLETCGSSTAIWGVTPGKNNQNVTKWSRLRAGDIALFYKNKKIFSVGKIVLTMHNPQLAASLWGKRDDGTTWEYTYFLDELQEIDIDIIRYNQALLKRSGEPYENDNIVQGFSVHEGQNAENLLHLLGLEPEDAPEEPESDLSLQQQLINLEGTDQDQKTKARKEMGILRKHLLGDKATGQCNICHKEFPSGFIVTAHIKLRSSCNDAERRDLNVVMRACRFGCDELFERGYILVNEQGQIEAGINLEGSTDDLKEKAKEVIGRWVLAFGQANSVYFEWHRTHLKRLSRGSRN